MKTLILLIPEIGETVTGSLINKTQQYFGIRNVDLSVDKGFPGCVYKDILTEDEKHQAENFILQGVSNIGVIFVEYEKDESDNDDCVTLIRKEER